MHVYPGGSKTGEPRWVVGCMRSHMYAGKMAFFFGSTTNRPLSICYTTRKVLRKSVAKISGPQTIDGCSNDVQPLDSFGVSI